MFSRQRRLLTSVKSKCYWKLKLILSDDFVSKKKKIWKRDIYFIFYCTNWELGRSTIECMKQIFLIKFLQ